MITEWQFHRLPKYAQQEIENLRAEGAAALLQLVRDLTDDEDCWLDHHGGCQTHGYLTLGPGQMCPHAEAKQVLDRASREGEDR